MVIHKFHMSAIGTDNLFMPKGARVLCVQVQNGYPCVWALVNPDAEKVTRRLRTFGTGHDVDTAGTYVGTIQLDGGRIVLHIFDEGEV